MDIKNVTVIGAGTMGNGIAQVFAGQNYKVILCDVSESALGKAVQTIQINLERMVKKEIIAATDVQITMANITTSLHIENGVAEVNLSSSYENIDLKLNIFKQMDQFSPPHCILATNTSLISITKIASVTTRPDKVIGMHFMNPVPVMKLVEVIRGYGTSDDVCS